jgi:hypothetical protein
MRMSVRKRTLACGAPRSLAIKLKAATIVFYSLLIPCAWACSRLRLRLRLPAPAPAPRCLRLRLRLGLGLGLGLRLRLRLSPASNQTHNNNALRKPPPETS